MKKAIFIILYFLIFASCENQTTMTQQKLVVCKETTDGTNLRLITITNNKRYWNQKQEEVVEQLNKILNSEEYNVISIKTFYSNAYLTSAEVKYSLDEDCENTKLKIKFFHSGARYWNKKQEEIKPRLEKFVNSGNHNIKDVTTIMLKGYLVAAEVYYYVEDK